MDTEKDAKDGQQEKPEEKKGFFERIGDFLSQPLPGTGAHEQEEDEKPVPRPTPSPAASTPATPPASVSPPPTPKPAAPPTASSSPATPKPTVPPESLHVPPTPAPKAVPSSPPLATAKSEEKASPSAAGGAAMAASGAVQPVKAGQLVVGRTAYVRKEGGMPLRMRSAPDLQADNIVARLPIGSQLMLLEGPKEEDGYEWWQVRTADGHTGWVAGSELVTEPQ